VSELDTYLASFREGAGEVRPPAVLSSWWRNADRRAKAYYRLRGALPPPLFDRVLAAAWYRPVYRARTLADRATGRTHAMPDFLVPGAAKCGTTSLFDWLCRHPQIVRPVTEGRARKELLFFDYCYFHGADWYRRRFPLERDRPFLTGEATATYLTHHWAPARVAELLPGVKLVVTLRDPVDRAYSAFQMSRSERLEECETFEAALALEGERLAPELDRMRRDPWYNPPPPAPLGYWSYLHRSRYSEHVERWLRLFPRERFLFVRFEDLVERPRQALEEVYEFLGLEPFRHDDLPVLNAGDYEEPMRPETREQLEAHFRPYNSRLRELTGIDFGWDFA
jgi:hypothetical protein